MSCRVKRHTSNPYGFAAAVSGAYGAMNVCHIERILCAVRKEKMRREK
jgi:hypothetical protein